MTAGSILQGVQGSSWEQFFDVMVMWVMDYPRQLMQRESGVTYQTLDRWVLLFQGKVVQALSSIMSKSWFWPKTSKKPKGAAAVRARGRSSLAKKKGKIAAKAAAQRGKAGITLTKKADVSNFKLVVQGTPMECCGLT